MHQPEATTLLGQAQILDGVFLPAYESQNMSDNVGRSARLKTPVGKKCPLKTVALAVKLWWKSLLKVKQRKVARVELRAGGGLDGLDKPGWSAGGREK